MLDLGLPQKDGMEVLQALRGKKINLPILVLTARDAVADRIKGLDLGADDYVLKPVDLYELGARLRSLVRRAHGQTQELLTCGAIQVNPATREVSIEGQPVLLSTREYDLLHVLMLAVGNGLAPLRHLSEVLARRQLQALEPVVLTDMPAEIAPVMQSLNALFERIGAMMTAERRFTADAVHELRTPIAAIRTQAQVALGATTDVERRHALTYTLAGCDRAAHLVEQLLTLSRLESCSATAPASRVDVSALAQRVAADMARLGERFYRALGTEQSGSGLG